MTPNARTFAGIAAIVIATGVLAAQQATQDLAGEQLQTLELAAKLRIEDEVGS